MSDFIKKLKGIELPDELLEAVSGGVMTAEEREWLEDARKDYATWSEEGKEKYRVILTEIWDAMSDEDKAEVYEDEYILCMAEMYMRRPLR